ncbi:uncharacterized protein EDB91DRAFT_1120238 [Suillus paluster]|uniref:uncharacterized protein n=1 Tax=Suillus paluster TaxID=48578 RepID=UPI001B87BD54|nr:uncharacterized protein EDB91DRAFT_1120238 [Suillus paluster]KAG1746014.1 hypothetical protein EDB91DRAFT_1120238 [Suillus paluster]
MLTMPLVVDNGEQRILNDDEDRITIPPSVPGATHSYSTNGLAPGTVGNGHDLPHSNGSNDFSGYTVMVAGQRTGKTSFLRLLLDTSEISSTATKDQLASVAKFVQGCSGHTSHIRTASINIDHDIDQNSTPQVLTLTLVDTPSLTFEDEASTDRAIHEILRHVESRFAEGIEDDWRSPAGDNNIHLCIYFLDPDVIVPPSVPGPPAPLVSRPRGSSFSVTEPEPVILEPPVTNNPLLCRPSLPMSEINTIRRLSARVNVLPVIARADMLTNDRLAAVKMAVRRDLAEAGIGFGIFDMDSHAQYQHRKDAAESAHPVKSEMVNGYSVHPNKTSPHGHPSPPNSPAVSSLKLPYALISPEIYSHSDGVARVPLSRHELVQQYAPLVLRHSASKLTRGKFIRSYRWGSMDVLDPVHSDFMSLRTAIFHHMETLQKYTREYLFEKFRNEYLLQHHPANHSLHPHPLQQTVPRTSVPLTHAPRPVLTIETQSGHGSVRHPPLAMPRDIPAGADLRGPPLSRQMADGASSSQLQGKTASGRSSKQRTKKITVACNFCRSRKLKCDGGRPACSQCVKRSNLCDYMPQTSKRRNPHRPPKEDSESEMSGEDRSAEDNEASVSPEIASQPLSRRSSNVVDKRPMLDPFSVIAGPSEPREVLPNMPSRPKSGVTGGSAASDGRSLFKDNELPHIATLSLPETSPAAAMTAPPLPPIRPASEQQAAQRKRASTVPGRSNRPAASTGPKVVACNFCRARKTKCDGAHPACSSCARRSLPCNYNHDSSASGANKKGARRASTSKATAPQLSQHPPSVQSPPANSPPSSTVVGDSRYSTGKSSEENPGEPMDVDLKRKMDDMEPSHIQKRMRVDETPVNVIP